MSMRAGGRVTDDKDRLLLNTILATCYCPELVDQGPAYSFTPSGTYHAPEDGPSSNYTTFVESLPLAQAPEAFGLHANAAITKDINATDLMLHSLLSMSGGSSSSGAEASAAEARVAAVVDECLEKLPPPFDLEAVAAKFPQSYQDSMNTVLVQEMARYNKLCGLLRDSLKSIAAALKGLLIMSSELEAAYKSISLNQVRDKGGHVPPMALICVPGLHELIRVWGTLEHRPAVSLQARHKQQVRVGISRSSMLSGS